MPRRIVRSIDSDLSAVDRKSDQEISISSKLVGAHLLPQDPCRSQHSKAGMDQLCLNIPLEVCGIGPQIERICVEESVGCDAETNSYKGSISKRTDSFCVTTESGFSGTMWGPCLSFFRSFFAFAMQQFVDCRWRLVERA